MGPSLDRTAALYAVVGLAGLAVVAWFLRNVFFDLSLTGRAVLLGLTFVAFLVGAGFHPWQEGFGLLAVTFFFFSVVYGSLAYDVGRGTAAILLFGSMWVAIGLAYLLHEGWLALSAAEARYALLGVLLVSVSFVGADLQYGEVDYDVELREEVTVTVAVEDGTDPLAQQVVLGTATATNTFAFREPVAFPDLRVCVYSPARMADRGVFYDDGSSPFSRSVGGHGTLTTNVTIGLSSEEATVVNGTLPVERAESCPGERDEPGIVVVVPEAMGG
ncbi:hypothetical protein OB920_17520 [Halobacteria archaeon HArc-gm2]|nr:hypothetical protein [Halobacteria archaeon HArc-gm2]